MGIINITPDSFSQDGCLSSRSSNKTIAATTRLAKKLVHEGADILDLGGESTRPGAAKISITEEIGRVIPSLKKLATEVNIPISIDTYKPIVARHALDAGACIVNNIMGSEPDRHLLKMIRDYNAAIVLMHIKGTPRTMQASIHYQQLIPEIIETLLKSVENCLEIGIKSDKIIIDPGIGFGKTVENNLEIINRLGEFTALRQPLLIGTSRKSFIGKILKEDTPDRLIGTITSVCASIIRGAHIVRVHNVKAIKEAVDLTDAILNPDSIRIIDN